MGAPPRNLWEGQAPPEPRFQRQSGPARTSPSLEDSRPHKRLGACYSQPSASTSQIRAMALSAVRSRTKRGKQLSDLLGRHQSTRSAFGLSAIGTARSGTSGSSMVATAATSARPRSRNDCSSIWLTTTALAPGNMPAPTPVVRSSDAQRRLVSASHRLPRRGGKGESAFRVGMSAPSNDSRWLAAGRLRLARSLVSNCRNSRQEWRSRD